MLSIMIYDRSKPFILKLAQAAKSVAENCDYDMDVKLLALSPERVLAKLSAGEKYLLIFEMNADHLKFYQKIRLEYRDAYIAFTTEDFAELAPALQMNIMPSGFLLKPVSLKKLNVLLSNVYNDYLNRWSNTGKILTVNIGTDIYKLALDEIVYIEALNKKINVVTFTHQFSYYAQLSRLEKDLSEKFIRCHRGYLINTAKIRNILFSEMIVEMTNGARLPISRGYKDNLRGKEALKEEL